MTEQISAKDAPLAVGPYSQGIAAGSLVFTAGEIPVDPATGVVPDGIEAQTRQALRNVKAVLAAGNVRDGNVVSVTVYLADMTDFGAMNTVYAEFFKEPFPARSCIQAAALPKGVLLMVSAIGVRD